MAVLVMESIGVGLKRIYSRQNASQEVAGEATPKGAVNHAPTGPSPELVEPRDDTALIKIVRGGGSAASEAFREMVERYQSRVHRITYEVLRSHEDTQDAVQETFVKAYLALKDFKGESSFYTWLYRIAFNMAVDWKRKLNRRGAYSKELQEDTQVPDIDSTESINSPYAALWRKQQGDMIQAVLNDLSDEHRAVIVLREIDEMSYEEIADVMGVSKGTVMSRLFYARKRMQEALHDLRANQGEIVVSAD